MHERSKRAEKSEFIKQHFLMWRLLCLFFIAILKINSKVAYDKQICLRIGPLRTASCLKTPEYCVLNEGGTIGPREVAPLLWPRT